MASSNSIIDDDFDRDPYEAELEGDLRDLFDQEIAQIDKQELIAALDENYVEGVERYLFRNTLLAVLGALFVSRLLDAFRAAGEAEASRFGIEFDPLNPVFVAAVTRMAQDAAVNVIRQAKETMRNVIIRGRRLGLTNAEIAAQLVLFMFLTDRQAAALQTQWAKMALNGMKLAVILSVMAAGALRALLDRLDIIAATEVTNAISSVLLLIWQEYARRQGALARKRWVTAHDEMVCPTCRPLHNVTVPLYSTFPGGFDAPPAHPRCRCRPELVL